MLGLLRRTSDSNFLNSASLVLRYVSISFFASSLASFMRFVRTISISVHWSIRCLRDAVGVFERHTLSRCGNVSMAQVELASNVTYLSERSSVLLFPPNKGQFHSQALDPPGSLHPAASGYQLSSGPTVSPSLAIIPSQRSRFIAPSCSLCQLICKIVEGSSSTISITR